MVWFSVLEQRCEARSSCSHFVPMVWKLSMLQLLPREELSQKTTGFLSPGHNVTLFRVPDQASSKPTTPLDFSSQAHTLWFHIKQKAGFSFVCNQSYGDRRSQLGPLFLSLPHPTASSSTFSEAYLPPCKLTYTIDTQGHPLPAHKYTI